MSLNQYTLVLISVAQCSGGQCSNIQMQTSYSLLLLIENTQYYVITIATGLMQMRRHEFQRI